MSDDPIRLREDPNRARLLREDLRAAAAAAPPALDLTAGLAMLEAALLREGPISGATAAGSATTASAGGVGWVVGVVGLAGIGAAVLAAVLLSGADEAAPRRRAAHGVDGQDAPARPAHAPPALAAPAEVGRLAPGTEAIATPDRNRSHAPSSRTKRPPASARTDGQLGLDLVIREIQLVGTARALLPHDPGAALAAAEVARREVPGGALAEEREALAILALHALGRREEARHRATEYLGRWPAGTQRARIRGVLDEGEDR